MCREVKSSGVRSASADYGTLAVVFRAVSASLFKALGNTGSDVLLLWVFTSSVLDD